MHDSVGDLCIVFNGEIYNFRELRQELVSRGHAFSSNSDTEVILAAYREWGPNCLSRFSGMFAFALYDQRHRQLFMARDRSGEKPLYFSADTNAVRFASELKALMADRAFPRRVDWEALDCYLMMGFVPGQRCMLYGIRKLPPAHALLFSLDDGNLRQWRYWELPALDITVARDAVDEIELLSELEHLLEDAVGRQLTADVPVGVLLSGGVDSSLVTAMAVRASPKVTTFTVRFPGHGKYDETEHARLVARHLGTEHVELEAAESTVDLLPLLARQFDEPVVDSSMLPTYLVSKLIRGYCKVVLGGDGGDELFAGYPHYTRLLWMQQRLGWIPRGLRMPIARAAGFLLPTGFKGRTWLEGLATNLHDSLPAVGCLFDRTMRERLLTGLGKWAAVAESIREDRIPKTPDLLQRATRMDFENYLAEDILVKVDRASMLSGLEVRAPLLDHRIIEFAFAKVPSHLKASANSRKVLLKRLATRLLPSGFDQHRKQGFSIPLASWLRSRPWQNFFQDVLLASINPIFSRDVVRSLLKGQAFGMANSERLFALVMFELWRHEYGVAT